MKINNVIKLTTAAAIIAYNVGKLVGKVKGGMAITKKYGKHIPDARITIDLGHGSSCSWDNGPSEKKE